MIHTIYHRSSLSKPIIDSNYLNTDMARKLYCLTDLINTEIMPVSLFSLGATYPIIIRFDKD